MGGHHRTPDIVTYAFNLFSFDYSFWMMLGALGAFAANIFLLLLSGLETKTKYASDEKETPVDNGVLMY